MLRVATTIILTHVAAKSIQSELWEEDGLHLLQLKSREIKSFRPSNDTDVVGLGKDEPLKWPEQLQYPQFNIPIPIRIFVWSFAGFLPDTQTGEAANCTVDYTSRDKFDLHIPPSPDYDISDADVVLFGLPNMLWGFPGNYILPREKSASQMWVTTCEEPYKRDGLSKSDCRLMLDEPTMDIMDASSSYDMLSDIPTLFDTVYVEDLLKGSPDFSARPSDELATLALSDCDSDWRNTWLEEIMTEINNTGYKVLSYGTCFHNTEEYPGEDPNTVHGWMNRAGARRFKLVAENVLQSWYVTEKIWNALAEGAVPVYLGPPEVKQMVPKGSFLYADDFPSTQALVQRMVDFTSEDFAKAQAWRQKPTSEWGMWEDSWLRGRHTMMNRFCEEAAKQKMAGTLFKSGTTPVAHDLSCCPEDPSCCMNGKTPADGIL